MKEYGSSVQKLVNYILTIADEEQRTKYAFLMVEVMKQIHPNMKDNSQDYSKKLWDDLYIMSNFELNVQGPFPSPSPESGRRETGSDPPAASPAVPSLSCAPLMWPPMSSSKA